jgi:hypothetical protein
MDGYRQWALEELGLAGPALASQVEGWKPAKDAVQNLKEAARRRGRRLLGKYHPDKHPGSNEALLRFRAINEVLQTLDDLVIPGVTPKEPRTTVSVSFYPEAHPSGPTIEVRTVRKSYFDFMTEETRTSGIQYDATRVIPMRPRKKF